MAAYVYILASERNGTLYVGVTTNLARRLYEHQNGLLDGFSKTHGVKTLVHVEPFDTIQDAIAREKRLKSWRRAWKIELIEATNPNWRDLSADCLI